MSYEQLYLHMKALEKERDELRAFIDDEGWITRWDEYEEIEHVV